MTVLTPQTIRLLCQSHNLISPCLERTKQNGMSYGLSQAGYDIRIAQRVVLYPVTLPNLFIRMVGSWFGKKWHPSFALASTVERFVVPNNLIFQIVDKSTWARRGLAVQNTQAEPGWQGYLTLELSNHGDRKLIIESGDPIAQAVFHPMDAVTESPYQGKYNNQPNRPVEDISEHENGNHFGSAYDDNVLYGDARLTFPKFISRKEKPAPATRTVR